VFFIEENDGNTEPHPFSVEIGLDSLFLPERDTFERNR